MGKEDDPVMPPMPNGKSNKEMRTRTKRASCTNCRQSKASLLNKIVRENSLTRIGEMQCCRSLPGALFELSEAEQRMQDGRDIQENSRARAGGSTPIRELLTN
jgi:hypothetical protein